jgi:hypothetical protein
MSTISRLVQIGYVLGLVFALSLLLRPDPSQAQTISIGVGQGATPGINTGFRGTFPLPTIFFPIITSGSSSAGFGGLGGGIGGISGGVGGGVSTSFSTQIVSLNLGSFFPDNGQLLGPPMPTFLPPLNNLLTDTTGAPWSLFAAANMGGGIGITGGMGGFGMRMAGFGNGMGGFGGGMGGFGNGMSSFGGGMGGFAGKGMGGFSGKKGL